MARPTSTVSGSMARISGGRNWRVSPALSITSPITAVNRRSRIVAKSSASVMVLIPGEAA